uniref:voltage-dependent calcium channel subunit alpha-2/delta-3-like n=1 Tax=Myxine glutinosa TaxID=7769 RepID=UPI00358EA5E1
MECCVCKVRAAHILKFETTSEKPPSFSVTEDARPSITTTSMQKAAAGRTRQEQFTTYQRLEKGVHIENVDGLHLVRRVARDMEAMFSKKVEAVKRLVITAEEAELQHTYEENLEYQYHNAVEQSQEHDTYGTEFDIEPNEHFGNLSVNLSLSSVQVPTNIYNQDPAIINGALWSTALNPVFIKNLENDPTLTWQYFGSMDGFFRQFPAIRWDMEINSERGVIEYDCRNRGWYIQASTSAKDVILLVDVSGSMKGLRMTIAKRTVTSILDTLGDNDFFNIIAYNDEVHYVESCLNGTLVQADRDTREQVNSENMPRLTDEILRPHVLPIMQHANVIFQQDNARPHTARLTTAFLRNHNIQVLPWPSRSPDLNPIEHLWDALDQRLRAHQQQPQNLRQLAQALQAEWVNIHQATIRDLIASMGRRCQSVLDSNGGHTRY